MKNQTIKQLSFEIYLPIMDAWYKIPSEKNPNKGYISPNTKKALIQIQKYSDKKIKLKDNLFGEIPLQISIIKEPSEVTRLLERMAQNNFLLKLEFDYAFDVSKFLRDKEADENASLFFLNSKIIQGIKSLIVAINIAIPGSISFWEGLIFINGDLSSRIDRMNSILNEMLQIVEEKKWPKIKSLDILTVWKYLLDRGYNFNNHSKDKIERALHCFSYFFGNPNNTEAHLLYSMMGIETIYAQGNLGLAEQIDTKCQLLLGKLKEFKKLLKQLYDFRSRFIHGDLDIAPRHFRFMSEEFEMNKFENDFFDSSLLSVAILTATLQKLIEKDADKVVFEYKYRLK